MKRLEFVVTAGMFCWAALFVLEEFQRGQLVDESTPPRTVQVIRSETSSSMWFTERSVLTTEGVIPSPAPDDYARLSAPGPHCVILNNHGFLHEYRHPGPCTAAEEGERP